MFFHIKAFILLLGFLALQVCAKGRISHAYEQLWLWEAYQVAVKYKGVDQKFILAITNGGKIQKGHGPDGSLTFQEFMDASTGRGTGKGLCKVDAPGPGRSFQVVAEALEQADFDGIMKPKLLNYEWVKSFATDKKAGLLKKPPIYLYEYTTFLQGVMDKLVDPAVKDPEMLAKIKDHLGNMHEISGMIESIREYEFQDMIAKALTSDKSDGGYGLSDDDVVKKETITNPYSGEKCTPVDVHATVKKMSSSADKKALKSWFKDFGKDAWYEAGKDSVSNPKQNLLLTGQSHLHTKTFWESSKTRLANMLGIAC